MPCAQSRHVDHSPRHEKLLAMTTHKIDQMILSAWVMSTTAAQVFRAPHLHASQQL